jgi:hypothetical protein
MRCLALLAALGACGTTDDRPQTLQFITEAILVPNCAQAECHSSFVKQDSYVFDTVEHAQTSLAVLPAITPGDPTASYLMFALGGVEMADGTRSTDNFGNRMPYDQPLSNADIYLIGKWIENGADGYTPPAP